MNILHIPSWYPNRKQVYAGIFNKELIYAIAKEDNSKHHYILNWHESASQLPLRNPLLMINNIFKYLFHRENYRIVKIAENITEIRVPVLEINPRFPNRIIHWYYRQFVKYSLNNFFLSIGLKIDLSHGYVAFPAGLIGFYLKELFEIPCILTEHMAPFPFKALLTSGNNMKSILYKPLMFSEAIIAVSTFQKKCIEKYIFGKNVEVIPNVINEEVFFPVDNKKNEFFNIICISTMSPQKGIEILLKSILALQKEGITNIKFTVGGGSNKNLSIYKSYAEDLGIHDNQINWFPEVSHNAIPAIMQSGDLFVLPSNHESFGVVYAEAIACGIPVIATECGGPSDIVNNKNGILIPIQDSIALTVAIKTIIKNYHLYDRKIIRKDFVSKFSRAVVARKYIKVYENAL